MPGLFISALTAFLFVFLLTPLFRGAAFKFRIVDFPGKRKMHRTMTPLLGGLAIYTGFALGIFMNPGIIHGILPILAGSVIILLLGLLDDIRGLSARSRLFVQLAAAMTVVFFGDRINFLPTCWWGDTIEIIVSLVWILGITNGYNYLDGLDGLAAGSAVINLGCFAIILFITGQSGLFVLTVMLAAACLGFLPYNFMKARKKVFLGDAGSTVIGFILASIGLVGYWAEGDVVRLSIPILILGVPIFDMVFTTAMRIAERKIKTVSEWLRYAGKDHFHHYLFDIGLASSGAVIFIYFTSILLGLSAIIVSRAYPVMALLAVAQGFIIFGMIGALIVMSKRQRSGDFDR